ncbi:MAG: dynamin family protein [Gloeotrichia echinulata HAB0833]
MTTYQQLKQKTLHLFQQAQAIAQSQGEDEIDNNLAEAKKRFTAEKLFVVVCGEFKQGKSNLLNAFLNETELFPVDVDITTNLVTTITYGKVEKITVVLEDETTGEKVAKQISRKEISNYVTEQRNQKNAKKAQMLIIEAPNPQLKEGLVLVDTPGVGGLNVEHTALTYAFIPNADAVLFVSDALAPLSQKELDFVTERITPHCENLIFVVTKIDAVRNYQDIVESNRQKLAQLLKVYPKAITIIPVSSKNKLDYLQSQDEEDLKDSNFTSLENKLWQFISQQRGRILLLNALGQITKAISRIQVPLEAELSACQRENQQELNALKTKIIDTTKRLQNLLSNNSDWLKQLQRGFQDIQDEINHEFTTGFIKVNSNYDKYLQDEQLLTNPQEIASLLEVDIDGLMSKISKQIGEKAADLHNQIIRTTGLHINPFQVKYLDYQRGTLDAITPIEQADVFDKALGVGRGVTYGGTTGSAIGGVIGGVIGGTLGFIFGAGAGAVPGAQLGASIGTLIGGVGGAVKGTQQQLSQIEQKDKTAIRNEVNRIIRKFINETQQSAQLGLKQSMKDLSRSMEDELTNEIKQEKQTYDLALNSLKSAEQLSVQQAKQREQDIKRILEPIRQLQQQTETVIQTALDLKIQPVDTSVKATVNFDKGDWADE